MSFHCLPHLIWDNPQPLALDTSKQCFNLTIIEGGYGHMDNQIQRSLAKNDSSAINTLQALLSAEANFLRNVNAAAAEHCPKSLDLEQLQRDLNHDNIFHISRFFFLLDELNCNSPEAIHHFIDSHNKRIMSLLNAQNFKIKKEGELKKALFKRQRQHVVVQTIRDKMRPVFARSEIADLLFDHMSRDSANKIIDLLCAAGLLTEVDDDPLEGSNRKLVLTNGTIENFYRQYLNDIQQGIVGGTPA